MKDFRTDLLSTGLTLFHIFPFPLKPSTTIQFELSENSHIQLKIFNNIGQEVRTLLNSFEPSGLKQTLWNGKDQNGIPAASGVYIYQLKIKTKDRMISKSRKMILVK